MLSMQERRGFGSSEGQRRLFLHAEKVPYSLIEGCWN